MRQISDSNGEGTATGGRAPRALYSPSIIALAVVAFACMIGFTIFLGMASADAGVGSELTNGIPPALAMTALVLMASQRIVREPSQLLLVNVLTVRRIDWGALESAQGAGGLSIVLASGRTIFPSLYAESLALLAMKSKAAMHAADCINSWKSQAVDHGARGTNVAWRPRWAALGYLAVFVITDGATIYALASLK